MFPEEVWEIVKSFLIDRKKILHRLFYNQLNEWLREAAWKEEIKWKKTLLLRSMYETESENESED
jgi:hypothetical protein